MIWPHKLPVRKCCGLVVPSVVVLFTGLWYFSVLYFQLQASSLTFQLENIELQSKSTLSDASFLTRRLSDVAQSWSDSRVLFREVSTRVSKERKVVIWGIEEDHEDEDQNNLIELLARLYGVTIDPGDVEAVKRVGVYRGHVPRPLLVYAANSHVKETILDAIDGDKEHPVVADDGAIERLERSEETQLACSMHIKARSVLKAINFWSPDLKISLNEIELESFGEFQLIRKANETMGAILNNTYKPANSDHTARNRTMRTVLVANKAYGNRILLEFDRANFSQNSTQPLTNYTLPYAWGGTNHVVMEQYFIYVRAKSNFIVKYDLINRRMVRYRQIKGAKFTDKGKSHVSCAYANVQQSDITLQADEVGLWALYYTNKDGMKLALLDHESLKVVKQYDTGWRKDWFEAIFVTCGVAYAIRRFQSAPFLQIKYAFNTIRGESSQPKNSVTLDLDPHNFGSIVHLSYDRFEKCTAVWTSMGYIGSFNVQFDYAAVPK